MNYFLKLFGWVLILALAAAVGAVSIFFNYRYGQAQGGTGFDGQLQGGVFALADAFKLCLPVLIATAWTRGHRALPAIGAVGFAGLVVLSAWSAYAYTVLSRAELTGTHIADAGRLAGLTAELKAIDVRLMALGELPPSGAIIAEIEGLRVDKRWYGTSGCKPVELTWDAARTFCATFASKNSMLARAVEAEALRAKRTTVAGHAAAPQRLSPLRRCEARRLTGEFRYVLQMRNTLTMDGKPKYARPKRTGVSARRRVGRLPIPRRPSPHGAGH